MRFRWSLALAAGLAVAGPAGAHHSYQMFDLSQMITVEGTVKELQWSNPHGFLQVMVKDPADGALKEWSFETPAVGSLRRHGWRYNSLSAGDRVSLVMSPLKAGTHGGFLLSVTLPNGAVLKTNG
jgi:hypothetical protein